jgi:hypothetical protein
MIHKEFVPQGQRVWTVNSTYRCYWGYWSRFQEWCHGFERKAVCCPWWCPWSFCQSSDILPGESQHFGDQTPTLFTCSASWLFLFPDRKTILGYWGHHGEYNCQIKCSSFGCLWLKSVLQSGRLHWRENKTIFFFFRVLCVYKLNSGTLLFHFVMLKYETGFQLWDTCIIIWISRGFGKLSESISKLQPKES